MEDRARESVLRGITEARNAVSDAFEKARLNLTNWESKAYRLLDGVETQLKFGDIASGFDRSESPVDKLADLFGGTDDGADVDAKYEAVRARVLKDDAAGKNRFIPKQDVERWRTRANYEYYTTGSGLKVLDFAYRVWRVV